MSEKINLNFHQTFKPEKQYLSSILDAAEIQEELSVQEISSYTGIPNGTSSGKVEPHIYYAKYMGLITANKSNGKYTLKLTGLGKIVKSEDPGLQELLTILLCHSMLLRPNDGASMWSNVFLEISPRYRGEIRKELILKELENIYEGKANTKNIAPMWGSYEGLFSDLRFLKIKKDSIEINSLQYNEEFIYLYAYIIFQYWEIKFFHEDEISELQLEELRVWHVFGWTKEKIYRVLENLSDRMLVRLNRQLTPYTILKLADSEDLLNKLYSELI